MARNMEQEFWLKDRKKSLGDSFSRMTSIGLPKQEKPVKKTKSTAPKKADLSSSYIRLEQIDQAARNMSYSEFLEQVSIHGATLAGKAVDALDLFIRCLKPNVQVSCEFNSILRSGYVELVRSENTIRATDTICNDSKSISGKAILINKKVSFEVCYEENFLVMKNVTGLQIGMDVINQVFNAEVQSVSFRGFDSKEYLQVIRAKNPIYRIKQDMPKQLTFVKVTVA